MKSFTRCKKRKSSSKNGGGITIQKDRTVHWATEALIEFIQFTSTPITVGIQGEWGSGKTSLINSIHHAFDSDATVKQIWINSWEYSLLSTPEEALLKIVNRIIDELLESDTDVSRKKAIKEGAGKFLGEHSASVRRLPLVQRLPKSPTNFLNLQARASLHCVNN